MVSKKSVIKKSSKNPRKETRNIVAIVLGSLSIIGALIAPYFYISGLLAIGGIILAYMEKGKSSKKLNTWAIVVSLIGALLTFIVLVGVISILVQFATFPEGMQLPQ